MPRKNAAAFATAATVRRSPRNHPSSPIWPNPDDRLTFLPPHILNNILLSIAQDAVALSAMSRTSKHLYNKATPLLYSAITITSPTQLDRLLSGLEARSRENRLAHNIRLCTRINFDLPPTVALTRVLDRYYNQHYDWLVETFAGVSCVTLGRNAMRKFHSLRREAVAFHAPMCDCRDCWYHVGHVEQHPFTSIDSILTLLQPSQIELDMSLATRIKCECIARMINAPLRFMPHIQLIIVRGSLSGLSWLRILSSSRDMEYLVCLTNTKALANACSQLSQLLEQFTSYSNSKVTIETRLPLEEIFDACQSDHDFCESSSIREAPRKVEKDFTTCTFPSGCVVRFVHVDA